MEARTDEQLREIMTEIIKRLRFKHNNQEPLKYIYCALYLMQWENKDFKAAKQLISSISRTENTINDALYNVYGMSVICKKNNHGKSPQEVFEDDVKNNQLINRLSTQWYNHRDPTGTQVTPPPDEDIEIFKELMAHPPGILKQFHPVNERIDSNNLSLKKQLILYGPPGTGKTYLTKKITVDWLSGGD